MISEHDMEKSLKILYVIDKMTVGGAQRHLAQVIPRINKTPGFSAELCCLSRAGELGEQLSDSGVPVHVLGIDKIYNMPAIGKMARLKQIIRDNKIDVVHTYLFSSNVYGVWAGHEFPDVRIISSRRDTGFELKYRHRLLLRWVNRWVDRFMMNSNAVKANAVRLEGVPESKCITVYNGVEAPVGRSRAERDALRQKLGFDKENLLVGMVANLRPVKDHKTFLNAAKLVLEKIPNAKFVLVGEGSEREKLEKMVEGCGLSGHVVFVGGVSNPREYFGVFDVSVLTSKTEGFSNSIIEAMAEGVPVVASNVGGNPEVVEDGVSGFLVNPGDAEKFAERIVKLCAVAELRLKIGEAGRMRVKNSFSFDGMINNILEMYNTLFQ